MFEYLLISEGIELVLVLAILAVVYFRRNTLTMVVRRYAKEFLGIYSLESQMTYRGYKSKLHAKRLNSHLRRLNVLEGKPAKKSSLAPYAEDYCDDCDNCEYGEGDFGCDSDDDEDYNF